MRSTISLFSLLIVLPLSADGPADNVVEKVRPVPPVGAKISPEARTELLEGANALQGEIEKLRSEFKGKSNTLSLLPDIQIFEKAVRWAVQYDEIFNPTNEVAAARNLLKLGQERVQQLRDGKPAWVSATGLVVRGYVSALDGSVQPYGLVVPASFSSTAPQPWRLDFWFHGRDEKLTELNFLAGRLRSAGEFTPRDAIVLHTYSRFCNGQKLAGESDVFEALADVQKRYAIDERRIVIRGFSLGGAAAWHIAGHYPGRWAAAAPGAGFSETPDFLKVFQNEKIQPTWYEQALWHQYDVTDYALNFFNLPLVAYSGEIDRQKQAADVMAKALAAEGMEMTHIIGPKTAHSYHPAAKLEINRRLDSIVALGRDPLPKELRFTTWTLRYHQNSWLTVDALEQHWKQARVSVSILAGNRVRVQCENVTGLTLSMPSGLAPFDVAKPVTVEINGQEMKSAKPQSDRSWTAQFHKPGLKWVDDAAVALEYTLRKRHGLQGPIDDAFMNSFLVVRPTGKSSNEKVSAWVASELAHFTNEWRRHFRGDARVKDDRDVTDADIAAHHLILWGDAESNALLGKLGGQLPIKWNAQSVTVGKNAFASANHVPLMIYPNPLNPTRYVVLNSGFTIREYDYLNNARQVPKLPDWAVVDVNIPPNSRWPGKVADAGFFGERWELKAAK